MASKRLYDSLDAETQKATSVKKTKKNSNNNKTRQHQNAFIDATFGQKYFFAGQGTQTSVPSDAELDFEDDSEAMAYLSSVRNQASGIPHLLVAPKVHYGPQLPEDYVPETGNDDEYTKSVDANDEDAYYDDKDYNYYDQYNDPEGFYEDGAYTAGPEPQQPDPATTDPYWILGEYYTKSITDRFNALRARLHRKPPPELVANLPRTHSAFVGNFGPKSATFAIWTKRILEQDPSPVQLAAMDHDAPLRVLRVLLGGKFFKPGHPLTPRTSRWLWSLLARMPEKGELQHTDIAWLRDLGKRAILLSRNTEEQDTIAEIAGSDDSEPIVETIINDSNDALIGQRLDMDDAEEEAVQPLLVSDSLTNSALSQTDDTPKPTEPNAEEESEEDEAMEMSDEGEIQEDALAETLEQAKARLLEKINGTDAPQISEETNIESEITAEVQSVEALVSGSEAQMNKWHTINMIIVVLSEAYGQRDLLEFKNLFPVI